MELAREGRIASASVMLNELHMEVRNQIDKHMSARVWNVFGVALGIPAAVTLFAVNPVALTATTKVVSIISIFLSGVNTGLAIAHTQVLAALW